MNPCYKNRSSKAQNPGLQSELVLIFGIKQTFTKLRETFMKARILNYFDPKRHIQIWTNVFGYAITGIFSQFILDNSNW